MSVFPEIWLDEMRTWKQRDLYDGKLVYIWADGVECRLRNEDTKLCLLVIIGAEDQGR
ncbi:MAG: hypothetical protein OXE41_07955 [Gammaproteobacteria bacterium]|nr:hypothetical protein [Gammaproteobacteria bacterium]